MESCQPKLNRNQFNLNTLVHELEEQNEDGFGVDNIVQGEDVLVLQLHQGDLADGGARRAVSKVVTDLLASYELAGLSVPSFEYLLLLARRS
jgi:hypothetical protein